MEQRFGALRLVGNLYRMLAVIILLGGIAVGILITLGSQIVINPVTYEVTKGPINILPALGLGFLSIVISLGLFGFAQLIDLMLALEENTRETAEILDRARKTPASTPAPRSTQEAPVRKVRSLLRADDPDL